MELSSAKRAIGLEIDSGSARIVELVGKPKSAKLTNIGSIDLPNEAVREGLVIEPAQVGSALKELWASRGIKERGVILGVSNQGVLVRNITIPKVPKDKLRNVVQFQAEEHLPIPLNNVVLDYLVLGETITSEEAQPALEVLLVAARRDMLNKFLEALELANLEPLDIDVSSMTQIGLLPEKAQAMTIAMVNVANGLNSILISDQGKPRLARLGMTKIIDLAEKLDSSLSDVFNSETLAKTGASDVVIDWTNSLAGEIRSSITYYQDQPDASQVEGVLLSGKGAMLKGIAAYLENNINLPVRIFNPLEEFNPAKRRMAKNDLDVVEYTLSAGLASRGLEG
ncbi:MAG: type IV pilus assembly protein PilM [Bacillota bacterium]|nr:type IV pilus assembly protein PilM [Bacillota bacterium]